MKILSPIDKSSEVGPLADAGVDELYGGYVSSAWRRRYSLLGSANQRYFKGAQVTNLKELKDIIKTAHGHGLKFYLTLNAPCYTESQYEDAVAEAGRYRNMGVDAFIVADLGLILRLKEALPDAAVHLSTLGNVMNSRSAVFFASLGISRIVLPRDLTIGEMAGIVKANPETEFDAFVLIGKCPNMEGLCSFTHNSPELVWPCEEKYEVDVLQGDSKAAGIIGAQAGWSLINRRQACGLCAVGRLSAAGISALKLVGRGGPTAMKAAAARAVRKALEMQRAGESEDKLRAFAKETYRDLFDRDCNRYVCYFPEIWR